eukprot:TRINITY_DN3287_c0_g1_i1.p1 TRINITY_DN3287_c0_g1~~TRINITY_DN3287_c0_g1_i1.p1  ORF type:complete len:131 (-),score=57.13 TRINITY_DN3287_c0_g1_i1:53-445(-)
MSNLAPSKCPRCKKTVYFAERQLYDDQYYHQLCAGLESEDRKKNSKPLFSLSEQIHCNPHDQKGELERMNNKSRDSPQTTENTSHTSHSNQNEEVIEEVIYVEGDGNGDEEVVEEIIEEVVEEVEEEEEN